MSLERMSVGAATAGAAMLAASVALGVSAWPGVALLVLATVAAGAQAVLDHGRLEIATSVEQSLARQLADVDGKCERRLERLGLKHDELAAEVESLKRRAALNSL